MRANYIFLSKHLVNLYMYMKNKITLTVTLKKQNYYEKD